MSETTHTPERRPAKGITLYCLLIIASLLFAVFIGIFGGFGDVKTPTPQKKQQSASSSKIETLKQVAERKAKESGSAPRLYNDKPSSFHLTPSAPDAANENGYFKSDTDTITTGPAEKK